MGILDFIFKRNKKPSDKAKAYLIPPARLKGKMAGRITHYFPRPKAAALKLSYKPISIGDKVYVRGHTTNFIQSVVSLQINNKPVKKCQKGKTVGIGVRERVRKGDKVYIIE